MITLEQLEKYFMKDEITGNLTFTDPEGVIPGFKLIFVEGGEYTSCDRKPIELSSFYMAEFQVTQEIWVAVTNKENPSRFQGINHPVEQVSWFDAVDFCNVLNHKIGWPPVCDKDYHFIDSKGIKSDIGNVEGFRLPTDAEWEYAARGGIKRRDTPLGGPACRYAGSNNIDNVGWHEQNSGGETKPVGLKFPNELGIYDMSGNGWEWCWDVWDDFFFKKSTKMNPVNISNGPHRVVRGGSWFDLAGSIRVADRYDLRPDDWWYGRGFRLSLGLQFTSEPGKSSQAKSQ
jgi:formylglycine-generating enzyme required for sulfatase activity